MRPSGANGVGGGGGVVDGKAGSLYNNADRTLILLMPSDGGGGEAEFPEREKRARMAPAYVPCSSLKVAGLVVAVVEVLLCFLAVYGLCRNFHLFGSSYFFWFIVGIVSVVIILLAIALLLYAIYREKPRWLIPHLSAQIFLILFLIIVALVVAVLLIFGAYRGIRNLLGVSNYYMSDDSTFLMGVMIIVIYLVIAILEVFFLYIVWNLYKHLRNYETMAYYSDEKNLQWQSAGVLPKDNKHGSPSMGDVYPYGEKDNMI